MSNFTFNPSIPLDPEFVQFGLDVRDANLTNGGCANNEYVLIDWVEFFESCPQKYDIQAAIIAGAQDEYIASDYIRAGNLGKGNSIVASNGKTSFKAMNYIELVPGFLSDQGSVLEIIPNVGCGDCERPKNLEITDPSENLNAQIDNFNKINDDRNAQDCNVYPNPTANYCSVIVRNSIISSIEVLDCKSQQINLIGNINKNQYQLDLSNLQAGIYYIVVLTNENEIFYEKVVKV